MKIGATLRFRILSRDRFSCVYCGAQAATGAQLQIDHSLPITHGGTNDEFNLVTSCAECNLGKGSLPLLGHDNAQPPAPPMDWLMDEVCGHIMGVAHSRGLLSGPRALEDQKDMRRLVARAIFACVPITIINRAMLSAGSFAEASSSMKELVGP